MDRYGPERLASTLPMNHSPAPTDYLTALSYSTRLTHQTFVLPEFWWGQVDPAGDGLRPHEPRVNQLRVVGSRGSFASHHSAEPTRRSGLGPDSLDGQG